MLARYFDSASYRFLTKDPEYGDEVRPLSDNPYAYVEGNPISNVDPEGLHGRNITFENYMVDFAGYIIMGLEITVSLKDGHIISYKAPMQRIDPFIWILKKAPKPIRRRNYIYIEASFALLGLMTGMGLIPITPERHVHHIRIRVSRGRATFRPWVTGQNTFLREKHSP